jgi:hypothetical protein
MPHQTAVEKYVGYRIAHFREFHHTPILTFSELSGIFGVTCFECLEAANVQDPEPISESTFRSLWGSRNDPMKNASFRAYLGIKKELDLLYEPKSRFSRILEV